MTSEKDLIEIATGEKFSYEWRITNLGEFENAFATFYKTITISADCSIQIKVDRLPIKSRHLPDVLHDEKIRIRDIFVEAILICHSSLYKMMKCNTLLRTEVEDFSDDDSKVLINHVFGESSDETMGQKNVSCYNHTDIMTYHGPKPNDMLTLIYHLHIIFTTDDILSISSYPSMNYARLFENKQFSDFIFTVDGQDFHIHRAVLALCSPVFEAIFGNDMTEKKDNRVIIDDIDPKVFKEVLRYIYTGKIENFHEIAVGLLEVADKYDIQGLKTICEQRMCIHLLDLPVEDIVVLLAFANMYRCEWLKSKIIEFIISHMQTVATTTAWNSFIVKNPQLTNEIRNAMIRAKVPIRF